MKKKKRMPKYDQAKEQISGKLIKHLEDNSTPTQNDNRNKSTTSKTETYFKENKGKNSNPIMNYTKEPIEMIETYYELWTKLEQVEHQAILTINKLKLEREENSKMDK